MTRIIFWDKKKLKKKTNTIILITIIIHKHSFILNILPTSSIYFFLSFFSCQKLYLAWFIILVAGTEEEAAEAYDIAAIKFRGLNAVTNFDMSRYDVKAILESNTLPIGGGAAKRLKEAQALESSRKREEMIALGSSSTFQYGTSASSSRLHAYPLMQHHQPDSLWLNHHYGEAIIIYLRA